jgi:hypothetical protein
MARVPIPDTARVEMRAKEIPPDEMKQVLDANTVFFEHLRAGTGSDRSKLDALVRTLQQIPS